MLFFVEIAGRWSMVHSTGHPVLPSGDMRKPFPFKLSPALGLPLPCPTPLNPKPSSRALFHLHRPLSGSDEASQKTMRTCIQARTRACVAAGPFTHRPHAYHSHVSVSIDVRGAVGWWAGRRSKGGWMGGARIYTLEELSPLSSCTHGAFRHAAWRCDKAA